MLRGRPLSHVVTALGYEPQNRVGTEAVNLAQVGTEHRVERRPHVEPGLIPPSGVTHFRNRIGRYRSIGIQCSKRGFDLDVALGHLQVMELIELQRLAQSEDVLRAVVSGECLSNRLW